MQRGARRGAERVPHGAVGLVGDRRGGRPRGQPLAPAGVIPGRRNNGLCLLGKLAFNRGCSSHSYMNLHEPSVFCNNKSTVRFSV